MFIRYIQLKILGLFYRFSFADINICKQELIKIFDMNRYESMSKLDKYRQYVDDDI